MMRSILALLLVLAVGGSALGQEYDMKKAPVVRNKLLMRQGRHEINPGFGAIFTGRYYKEFFFTIGYQYHMTDWLALGANGGYALPIKTGLADDVESERSTDVLAFSIPATHLGAMADVHISLVPSSGKLLLFGQPLQYDFHMNIGAAALQVLWNKDAASDVPANDEFVIAPMLGGGFRLFLTQGVALSLDMTDYFAQMYVAAPVEADNKIVVPERTWTHNLSAMLTVNIFLPYLGVRHDAN